MSAPDPLPSVARVRKARRSSVVACGHYVRPGHVIVRREGRWICLECALERIRNRPAATAASTEGNSHDRTR